MAIMERTMQEEILLTLSRQLDTEALERLVIYARALKSRPPGTPIEVFMERTEHLHIESDDVEIMQRVIEEEF